ncbi:dTDP-4-dehydrorhamnose 3,5-epimerase [Seongchinamella sediminis]|uniref:dTDP-4-dehydrorhamnose 3,5-epimerase n=1 Tax=Seongchinamella sediminis TaxID=2283635 RepID=A0A3L7DY67_9GAMM|nr:dTDP-4-dehydrorhamnose 3,5-epimerase [Seongchinamella sediminis]RLQ22136.1 dTDP-4-dehydrorhamnose 3,5-epimerase [Seongchinamella sediminis]
MKFETTPLQGVYLLSPRVFGDERGFFLESWNARTFANEGFDLDFVQDNHSRSARGILRGLHYQTEHTQGKLVRVTQGAVFDVVVDMRRDSPTLGQWYGVTLSAENHQMLWVPAGFAHGFYVLTDSADFQYKCTDIYHPESEVSLAWDDPQLGIEWPLPAGEAPQLSGKDAHGLAFSEAPLLD